MTEDTEPHSAATSEGGDQQSAATSEGGDQQSPADDVHRKFREALQRKQVRSSSGRGTPANSSRSGLGPGSNDKTKRQFRRKSGG